MADREGYEAELVRLWREYSEDKYFAGFMTISPEVVHDFAEWLASREGSATLEKFLDWHRRRPV